MTGTSDHAQVGMRRCLCLGAIVQQCGEDRWDTRKDSGAK
jgi:hypothetical protein